MRRAVDVLRFWQQFCQVDNQRDLVCMRVVSHQAGKTLWMELAAYSKVDPSIHTT